MILAFFRRLLESEPTLTISVVAAALALLVTFGVHISDAQIDAITKFVATLLTFLGAVAGIRQSVYAPDTHSQEVAKAAANG